MDRLRINPFQRKKIMWMLCLSSLFVMLTSIMGDTCNRSIVLLYNFLLFDAYVLTPFVLPVGGAVCPSLPRVGT
jgi:hypothetical protein